MERALTKPQIIAALTKSPHGDLSQYVPIGTRAAQEDSDFFGHLVAWNHQRGAIRDAKVALPVLALTAPGIDLELQENAIAHILRLDPRNRVRAVRFARPMHLVSRKTTPLGMAIEQHLHQLEQSRDRFLRTVVQHRASLKELYALLHIKPGTLAQQALFEGKKIGVLKDVAELRAMDAQEAAGTIMGRGIPFLIARGALGPKAKDPVVVQALIQAMSPSELVTNAQWLEKVGVKHDPGLRAAFEQKMASVSTSKKVVLKTARAAQAVGGVIGEKLAAAQEKQLDNLQMQGNWLVLGDKSGSMSQSIDMARHIAATLARVAGGDVHLIFFDSMPYYHNVTGKSLEEIQKITKRVSAGGGTYIGCGLRYATEHSLDIDGVALVSDGGDNGETVAKAYKEMSDKLGKEVPLYFYRVPGDGDGVSASLSRAGFEFQKFEIGSTDYYALPNLIQTMRTNRYGLVDEIMSTPLLRLADVLRNKPVAEEIESEEENVAA